MDYYGYTDLHCYERMGPTPRRFVSPTPMELNDLAYDATSVIGMMDEEDVGFSDFYAVDPKRKLPEETKTEPPQETMASTKKRRKKTGNGPAPFQSPTVSIPAVEVKENVVVHPATAPCFTLSEGERRMDPRFIGNPFAARFDYLHRLCLGRFGPCGILYHRIFDATLLFMPERVTVDTLNITAFTGNPDGNARGLIVGTTKCVNSKRPFFICMQCCESTFSKPYIHNTYAGIISHYNTDHDGSNPGYVNTKRMYE